MIAEGTQSTANLSPKLGENSVLLGRLHVRFKHVPQGLREAKAKACGANIRPEDP